MKVKKEELGSAVYASDLKASYRTDAFWGQGFEQLLSEAEKTGNEVIVGYYIPKPYIDK